MEMFVHNDFLWGKLIRFLWAMLIQCINFPRLLLIGFILLFLEKWYQIMSEKRIAAKYCKKIFKKCVSV